MFLQECTVWSYCPLASHSPVQVCTRFSGVQIRGNGGGGVCMVLRPNEFTQEDAPRFATCMRLGSIYAGRGWVWDWGPMISDPLPGLGIGEDRDGLRTTSFRQGVEHTTSGAEHSMLMRFCAQLSHTYFDLLTVENSRRSVETTSNGCPRVWERMKGRLKTIDVGISG